MNLICDINGICGKPNSKPTGEDHSHHPSSHHPTSVKSWGSPKSNQSILVLKQIETYGDNND